MTQTRPILVLQMQRMGDLVLSFPLLGRLRSIFPDRPVWVVGERAFFEPLMPLSPEVTYFSYESLPKASLPEFSLAFNLSHRPEAARLAGSVKCDALFGPFEDANGNLHVRGDWQLYRASLTDNNAYNLFHWADLHCLDLVPERLMLMTQWPEPRPFAAKVGTRIGLFIGASEEEKRPTGEFWAGLAALLLRAGHKPALLGGPAEKEMGQAVAARAGIPALNLCGRFSVRALAEFMAELDLLVTPDTGPMHVAAWTGTPVLNLSLGPVNPWETGPCPPGHHVLRAHIDCTGCWRCTRDSIVCRDTLTPAGTEAVIRFLLQGQEDPEALRRKLTGLALMKTGRDGHGLFNLTPIFPPRPAPGPSAQGFANPEIAAREELGRFWQAWFGEEFGRFPQGSAEKAWASLASSAPEAAALLRRGAVPAAKALALAAVRNAAAIYDSGFWEQAPPLLRPLSGFIQMKMQNEFGSRQAALHCLGMMERLVAVGEEKN